jgi:RNase P/RNase MRP subunit p29
MEKKLLLGSMVQVVDSPNNSQIGIKGKVVYEQNKNNGYLIIYSGKKYKLIEKGVVKLSNRYIHIENRFNRGLKGTKWRITTL